MQDLFYNFIRNSIHFFDFYNSFIVNDKTIDIFTSVIAVYFKLSELELYLDYLSSWKFEKLSGIFRVVQSAENAYHSVFRFLYRT